MALSPSGAGFTAQIERFLAQELVASATRASRFAQPVSWTSVSPPSWACTCAWARSARRRATSFDWARAVLGLLLVACGGPRLNAPRPAAAPQRVDAPRRATAPQRAEIVSAPVHETAAAPEPVCEFEPEAPSAFDACGGSPFGVWVATTMDVTGFVLSSNGLDDHVTRSCPTAATQVTAPQALRLELTRRGVVKIDAGAGSFSFRVTDRCVRETTRSLGCRAVIGLDCKLDACNICSCEFPLAEYESVGTFTRAAGELTLHFKGDDSPSVLPYCVKDGRLRLRGLGGFSYDFQPAK